MQLYLSPTDTTIAVWWARRQQCCHEKRKMSLVSALKPEQPFWTIRRKRPLGTKTLSKHWLLHRGSIITKRCDVCVGDNFITWALPMTPVATCSFLIPESSFLLRSSAESAIPTDESKTLCHSVAFVLCCPVALVGGWAPVQAVCADNWLVFSR